MDDDLSLSQSFGGLRIANPDHGSPEPSTVISDLPKTQSVLPVVAPDTDTTSENETQNHRRSFFNILQPANRSSPTSPLQPSELQGPLNSCTTNIKPLVSPLEVSAPATAHNTYRRSMPLNHQAQQDAIFPPYQQSSMQYKDTSYRPVEIRPASGLYSPIAPPNTTTDRQSGSYRLRSESSKSSAQGFTPGRTDTRNAGAAMAAGAESRDGSHRERAYSQNHPLPPGSGPLPPRQSSRGMAGSHVGTSQPNIFQQSPSSSVGNSQSYGQDGFIMPSTEDWKERGAAVGVRQEIDASGKPVLRSVKKGVRDFSFGRTLGEGSYSTVLAATDRQTLKEYAVKVLDKRHIIKEKKIKYVNIEKNTLNRLTEHPGIVRLYYTFQDEKSLYYVLDVASGGELLGVLKKIGTFDEECTRFYGAQILDSIDYMHSRGVIHRDLKPENVLLDDQMHVKITDFGTAKLLKDPLAVAKSANTRGMPDLDDGEDDNRATSFVGTAEYVSPELLTDKNACKASDLWAFGCIIYQLLSSRPPFKAANEYLTFQKIVGLQYEFPPGFPAPARDLVERLLVLDPSRRLSIEHVKNHEFFDGIKWGRGLWRMKAPRLKPYVPPERESGVIKLNGYSNLASSVPIPRNHAGNGISRPQPRIITELPPPTQLDIEWSPV